MRFEVPVRQAAFIREEHCLFTEMVTWSLPRHTLIESFGAVWVREAIDAAGLLHFWA